MKILVKRHTFTDESTTGDMFIDGEFFCHTIEDKVREPGVKIPKQTAIPYGTYKMVIDFSNRFKRLMPHILDVPMFDGIRIHSGNTDEDTEGCILVGLSEGKDMIGSSKLAYDKLMKRIDGQEDLEITIERGVV